MIAIDALANMSQNSCILKNSQLRYRKRFGLQTKLKARLAVLRLAGFSILWYQ